MRKNIIESRGFSLLEVIFVLAFLGIILLTAGNYARKLIDEKTRQTAADAVVQDIYGVLQFVNAETIKTYTSNNPGDVTGRATKDVTNPLYQLPGMAVYPESEDTTEAALKGLTSNPIWLAHPHSNTSLDATSADVSPYIARNYSTGITRPVSNDINMTDGGKTHYSHSLKWSQSIWGPDSVRSYFTDSACQGGTTGTGNEIYFSQQFLSCSENPALHNSEIGISRIDLVNDKGSFTRIATSDDHPAPVNRVDVYVSFRPVDENSARIEQFITPLMTAFRMQKIMPNTDNIFLVRSLSGIGNDNAWTLLNKNTGQPANKDTPVADLARYSDLPDLVGKLQKGQTYALRFTFDGKGDYLRTDGVNAATKVCWNTKDGVAGPCLTSPAPDALILKRRDNPQEFANLQVNSVVSTVSHRDANGKTVVDEYYTAPRIRYAAFSNTGQIVPYYRNPDGTDLCTTTGCGQTGPNSDTVANPANGAISVPVQICPQTVDEQGKSVTMHPRLSTAVSSAVSGIRKDAGGSMLPDNQGQYFDDQSRNMVTLSGSDISINRLGGVIFQVTQENDSWRIAGMVGSEDIGIDGHPWQYYNPPWLSVMITTWCSSVPQS
ncbi:type II secretion system protein [Salmonella enterica subsp. enterica serovar Amager]|nr:type II secretion system protein [Salmonella enterica subsp. enterica serovar Amager]EBV5221268.1 type II secretion system protein [Salmonella enterica subsp. enterica serovar Amager]EBW4030559.1 type II secretion system protein [Salmonella enterica subsp. enterica serovar Newport]